MNALKRPGIAKLKTPICSEDSNLIICDAVSDTQAIRVLTSFSSLVPFVVHGMYGKPAASRRLFEVLYGCFYAVA